MVQSKDRELNKKPEEYALEYAGFWIRLGAVILDTVILGLFLSMILYAFSRIPIPLFSSKVLLTVFGFISWFIQIAYSVSFCTWRGQTPGKIITGIKVIRTDSSPITWQYALLRYLGSIVSTLALCIGYIWIAFDSRKQGWHDKIADTYVVKLPVRQVAFTPEYVAGGKIG